MAFGLTTEGFVPKRQEDITSELQASIRAEFGDQVDLDPRRPIGQLIGIISERLAFVWALSEGVYNSKYPVTASGNNLDNAVSLTGLTRNEATFSIGQITITGDAGTSVAAGFQVAAIGDATKVFETTESVVIGGGGTVDAAIRAVDAGNVEALAGTLTEIVNPLTGVDSVTNASDVTAGSERETDAELRLRQQEFLQIPGTSSVEGIRAEVAEVDGVNEVIVVENDTNSVDGDGRPAKSFETFVDGGDAADIAEAIWASKPAGIETVGDITETITDSQGLSHDINFSRPTEIEITVDVTITANADVAEDDLYPADGDDQVEAAVLEYADTLTIGKDVFLSKMYSFINQVPGVIGISIEANKAGGPTVTDTIAIGASEVATFDSARITVTSS